MDCIKFTEEEMAVIMIALIRYSDMDYNPHLTEEQYEIAQSALGKCEAAL